MRFIALLALLALPAFAADDKGDTKDPCAAEKEKYCKGMKDGDARLRGCLKEKIKELSIECQRAVDKMPVKMTRSKWHRKFNEDGSLEGSGEAEAPK